MPVELVGGFESTYLPGHDRDVTETTEHDVRWRSDLRLLVAAGVRTLRYPVLWHRVEAEPGRFDWRHTDEVMAAMADLGLRPIVDLVHHTSYPRWLERGFADPRFPQAYLRYVEAFCRRYPQTRSYTLFNEPFATLFLCGHEAIWPPYEQGMDAFVAILRNVLPTLAEASRVAHELLPAAEHVWVDACERHEGGDRWGRSYARMANDRVHVALDAFLGRLGDGFARPFVGDLVRHGGEDLLAIDAGHVDVIGLDYYAHCQWHFAAGSGMVPRPSPPPLAALIEEWADRYELPVMLTETNLRGMPSDRASWFKYTLEQCEQAVADGVDVRGYCWFPTIDSADWDSLLYRCEGNVDPVGVWWLDEQLERRPSSMSRSFQLAASGVPAADLPAYRFQAPADRWLAGYAPHMAHWHWQDPPAEERVPDAVDYDFELRVKDA